MRIQNRWNFSAYLPFFLTLILCLLGGVFFSSLYDYNQFSDIVKRQTHIRQFIERKTPVSLLYSFEKDSRRYIWWQLPIQRNGIFLPSGPAVFIFDEQGVLCDYSLDIGEEPSFTKTWMEKDKDKTVVMLSELISRYSNTAAQ